MKLRHLTLKLILPLLLVGLASCAFLQTAGIVSPDVPTGLVVGSPTTSTLDLSWDSSNGAKSYALSMSQSQNGPWTKIATTADTGFTATGLNSATTYWFKVVAANPAGDSPPSAPTSGTTLGGSGGGGTVAAPGFSPAGGTFTSAQSVTISSSATGASIRYTTDGTAPTSSTGTLYTTPVDVAASMTINAIAYKSGLTDSAISSATYTIGTTGVASADAEAAARAALDGFIFIFNNQAAWYTTGTWSTTGLDFSMVPATQTYTWIFNQWADPDTGYTLSGTVVLTASSTGSTLTVTANNLALAGGPVSSANLNVTATGISSGSSYYAWSGTVTVNGQSFSAGSLAFSPVPSIPQPSVYNAAGSSLDVSWFALSFDSTPATYTVYRDTQPTGGFATLVYSGSSTFVTDSGLLPNMTYYYKAMATNSHGSSVLSAAVSATTSSAAPAVPTGLTASSPTTSSLYVYWTYQADATYYVVQRDINSSFTTPVQVYSGSNTSFTDNNFGSGLASGTTYYYQVQAVNASGVASAWTIPQFGSTNSAPRTLSGTIYAYGTAYSYYDSTGFYYYDPYYASLYGPDFTPGYYGLHDYSTGYNMGYWAYEANSIGNAYTLYVGVLQGTSIAGNYPNGVTLNDFVAYTTVYNDSYDPYNGFNFDFQFSNLTFTPTAGQSYFLFAFLGPLGYSDSYGQPNSPIYMIGGTPYTYVPSLDATAPYVITPGTSYITAWLASATY